MTHLDRIFIAILLSELVLFGSSHLLHVPKSQKHFITLAEDLTCNPSENCKTMGQGKLVPDPRDCHKFYVCITINGEVTNSGSSISCPDGEYFNPNSNSLECETETATPCEVPNCGGGCSLTCSESLQLVGDPKDCSRYSVCLFGGGKVSATCPNDTPYFNGAECTDDIRQCCNFCTAICNEPFTQIPDPQDCRKYFVCLNTGQPDETTHFDCGTNQVFDPDEGTCVSGTSCTPICRGGGGQVTTPSGTTPSGTTPSGTTPPGTTPSGEECKSSLTCTSAGNFAQCQSCENTFFHCDSASGEGTLLTCPGNNVFNTDPQYPFCVLPENCPYSP